MRDKLIELLNGKMKDCFEYVPLRSVVDIADYLLANGVIVPPCKVGEWDENGRCTNCGWYMPFDCEGNAFESMFCPTCGVKMGRRHSRKGASDD